MFTNLLNGWNSWKYWVSVELEFITILWVRKRPGFFQYYDSQGFVDFRQSWNFLSDPGSVNLSSSLVSCNQRLYLPKSLLIHQDSSHRRGRSHRSKNCQKSLSVAYWSLINNSLAMFIRQECYTFRNNYFFYDNTPQRLYHAKVISKCWHTGGDYHQVSKATQRSR